MSIAGAPSDRSDFEHRGWLFSHVSLPHIASARELTALSETLSLGSVPLPEMTFTQNFLEVAHAASGLRIRFDAEGALLDWHERQRASSAVVGGVRVPVSVENYDFTYTTAYEGAIVGSRADSFTPATEELPLDRLRERAPMLAYARVPLFASDLNDRGTVEALVKLRVMDDAFLLLFRAFTRLDRDRVRLHDVRFYHAFGEGVVLKDVQERVAFVADVIAADGETGGDGLPTGPPSFFASPPSIATTPEESAASSSSAAATPEPSPSVPPPVVQSAVSPRTVHPVVLASMRERAAKQGLAVRDDDELISILCATSSALPSEFTAMFASPPAATRGAARSVSHSHSHGFAHWPARPGALALSPATVLLAERRSDDTSPMKLDVSAEQTWGACTPNAHRVFSFTLDVTA